MEAEPEVDFVDLVRDLTERKIRYLVIGRRAVILYGGPVMTADYDLWIDPSDRQRLLSFLSEDLNFELSHPPSTRQPIVTAHSGLKKFDLFFHRSISNIEGDRIDFEQVHSQALLRDDPAEGICFPIPCVDDLIRLKKIREPNAKDEQDIAYLLKAKELFG